MNPEEVPLARQPIFNVPQPIVLLLSALIAIHAIRQVLSAPADDWFVVTMAFIPLRYAGEAALLPGGLPAAVTSFVTHTFIHGDIVHLTMNSVWLLAFGPILCRRIGWLKFFVFYFACGAAGAALFLAFNFGLAAPVVGASGAIAGLMGAVMRFLFSAIDRRQGPLLSKDPAAIPRMDLPTALRDRRVVTATGVFIGLNMLIMLGLNAFGTAGSEPGAEAARIAWEAHVGGYLFGLLTFGLFDCAPQRISPTPPEVA